MDPITIAMLAKGALGIGQMIAGANKPDRPEYEIPSGVKNNLALARASYNNSYMPGEQRALDRIDLSAAQALSAAKETGNAVGNISKIQANSNTAKLDLAEKSSMYSERMLQNLQQAQQQYAKYQDQKFQMNEFAPFADKARRNENLLGAGIKNFAGAVDQGIAMQMLGGKMSTDEVDSAVESSFSNNDLSDMFSTSGDLFENIYSNIG